MTKSFCNHTYQLLPHAQVEFETPQPKWHQCPCLWFGKLSQLQCQWPWFSDTGPLVIVTVSGRPLCTEQLINHYNWWVVAPFILLFIMTVWCEIAIHMLYKELRRKYLSDWNKFTKDLLRVLNCQSWFTIFYWQIAILFFDFYKVNRI